MMLDLLLIYMLGMLPFSDSKKVVWRLLPLWMNKLILPIKVELKWFLFPGQLILQLDKLGMLMYSLVHVYKLNLLNQLEEQWLVRPFLRTCGSIFGMDISIMFIYSFIGGFFWSTTYDGFLIK